MAELTVKDIAERNGFKFVTVNMSGVSREQMEDMHTLYGFYDPEKDKYIPVTMAFDDPVINEDTISYILKIRPIELQSMHALLCRAEGEEPTPIDIIFSKEKDEALLKHAICND